MGIKKHLVVRSQVLKDHVNKYAVLGLGISILSIFIASILVSYQLTGFIDFNGVILAHKSNPALWALDLTPFMFTYWGQSFCYEVANTMESMLEDRTKELMSKSSELEFKLHYESLHDHLTHLPNLRLLSERMGQGMQQLKKGEQLAIIIIHINAFKDINFKYGSFNANSLLTQFAEKLKTVLLEPKLLQAYMGMNMVARLQGAEFAILIPRLRKEHNLEEIITKILELMTSNFMVDGNNINITISAGIAVYPLHADNVNSLIRNAGVGLFYAEKEGKPYDIYQTGMIDSTQTRGTQIKELSTLIQNEELDILYQPILELKTEAIIGLEVHVIYDDTQSGVMDLDKITPLVEGTIIGQNLTVMMLQDAIKQLGLWHQAGHHVYVVVQLFDATDLEFPNVLNVMLKNSHISPEFIKIGLTEKSCLTNQSRSMTVLKQLADLGVQIVITDFCSGYTSFTYLTNFPIHEIKIEKSFIMNMLKDEKKLNVVRVILKLAETLKVVVLADGIEDQLILKQLKQLKCLYGQGNFYSAAISSDEITRLFNKPS